MGVRLTPANSKVLTPSPLGCSDASITPGGVDTFWASIGSPGQPVIFSQLLSLYPSSSLTDGQTLSKEPPSHALKLSTPEKVKDAQLNPPGELARRLPGRTGWAGQGTGSAGGG